MPGNCSRPSIPGDRALVLKSLAHRHAASGDVLALGRVAAEARHAQNHGDTESEAESILHTGQALQTIEDHAAAIKYSTSITSNR